MDQLLILGESGKGKTTFLHLLSGLLKIQSGSIKINGTKLESLSETQRDHYRGKHIGLVFQKPHLISSMSIKNNLALSQYLAGTKSNDDHILELLELVQLSDKANDRISELSAGQAQRISVIRALLNKPGLILADEPTSSLDDRNAEIVTNILLEQSAKLGAILIVATHDQRVKEKIKNQFVL